MPFASPSYRSKRHNTVRTGCSLNSVQYTVSTNVINGTMENITICSPSSASTITGKPCILNHQYHVSTLLVLHVQSVPPHFTIPVPCMSTLAGSIMCMSGGSSLQAGKKMASWLNFPGMGEFW